VSGRPGYLAPLRARAPGFIAPVRARIAVGEAPRRQRGVGPVVFGTGKRTQCKPFLVVQKDPELFAACNALADEVGPINTPKKAFRLLGEAIGNELNEVFGVMTLDIHLRLKGLANTGRGESASVMAPIQSTLRTALASGGDYAILYHVHPSGIEAEPSDADKETTEAFVEAFEVIGMPLIDHVIVGGSVRKKSYFSFAEADLL
jgi:DNA repair protein RadC